MEIISRNLEAKKLLKLKYQENPQTESEKQLPQPPAFTGLQSLKGLNQLGKYGMAAVVLAGTMLGATSCEKTEINKEEIWNVTVKDNSEEYLKTLIALVEAEKISKDDSVKGYHGLNELFIELRK